jgi:hypothetical protein
VELRKSQRYRPDGDVLVALYLASGNYLPKDDDRALVGYLADLSLSGLAFTYLSFNTPPALGSCRVILKNVYELTDPIPCRVVHEVDFPAQPGLPNVRRCGLEFLMPLESAAVPKLITGFNDCTTPHIVRS